MASVKMWTNVSKTHVTRLQFVKIHLDRLHAFVLMGYWAMRMQKGVTIQTVVPQKMTVQKVLFVTRIIVRIRVKTIKYVVVMRFAQFNDTKSNVNVH